MSKHTPGPWTYDAGYLTAAPDIPVAIFEEGDFSISEPDARLVAAAPDLLEAAKKMEQAAHWMLTDPDNVEVRDVLADAQDLMRAAIAKAEGEQ